LYELNKDAIGKNPDLLQGGTKLQIPQWDSTGGDEKIEEKGGKAFRYTGGLRYRYPWVAFSLSLVNTDEKLYREKNEDGEETEEFQKEKKYVLRLGEAGDVVAEGTITRSEEIQRIVVDTEDLNLEVDGEMVLPI
ncbi:MAG: hypothetical protein ACOC4C_05635, partial [Fibrobacterota bacterium]